MAKNGKSSKKNKINKTELVQKEKDKQLTSKIKKEVLGLAETKIVNIDGTVAPCGFSGTNWNVSNSIPITPYASFLTINQGTGQADRIGDKITVSNVMLRMVFTPKPYNGSTNLTPKPQLIKLFLVNAKSINTINTRPNQANMNTFFQEGNSYASPAGDLFDMIEEVNRDAWSLYATKTIKLGYGSYNGTGFDSSHQYFENNDYKLNHIIKWDITKYIPQTMQWNDASANPASRGLFLVILCANADGSAPASTSIVPVNMNYDITIKYKDL